MENLWIDVTPFMKLTIPSNIKNWNSIERQSLIKGSEKIKDNLDQYDELTQFIFTYLEKAAEVVDLKSEGKFMLQIINLCIVMLEVGFFTNYDDFELLFGCLSQILKKTDSVVIKDYHETFKQSHDSEVVYSKVKMSEDVLNIKLKCCELLKMLQAIKTDLKLNNMIKKYKKNHHTIRIESTLGDENVLSAITSNKKSTKSKDVESGQTSSQSTASKALHPDAQEFQGIFEDIIMEDTGCFIKRDHEIVELLINQSLYPYNDLKSIALENIYLLFRDAATMNKRIDNLQIIEDNHSLKELDSLEEISHYLFRLGETMEVWYTSDSKEKIKQLTLLLRRLEINMHRIEMEQETIENCD